MFLVLALHSQKDLLANKKLIPNNKVVIFLHHIINNTVAREFKLLSARLLSIYFSHYILCL